MGGIAHDNRLNRSGNMTRKDTCDRGFKKKPPPIDQQLQAKSLPLRQQAQPLQHQLVCEPERAPEPARANNALRRSLAYLPADNLQPFLHRVLLEATVAMMPMPPPAELTCSCDRLQLSVPGAMRAR